MKTFEATHLFFETDPEAFSEKDPPKWLVNDAPKGSTMDNRWFWEEHVLTLGVGESIEMDFRKITRNT